MPIDYSKGKIYKLVSNETDKIYIGSTCQPLAKRKGEHKRHYNYYLKEKHHYITSFELIKYDDCDIVLIEECPCENKDQLHKRERYFIESLDCVNKFIPARTQKEYCEVNRAIILDKKKRYYEANKDKMKDKMKEYYEDNKDIVKDRIKKYCEENKDMIKDKKKQYYEANKDKKKQYYQLNKDKILEKRRLQYQAKKTQ